MCGHRENLKYQATCGPGKLGLQSLGLETGERFTESMRRAAVGLGLASVGLWFGHGLAQQQCRCRLIGRAKGGLILERKSGFLSPLNARQM